MTTENQKITSDAPTTADPTTADPGSTLNIDPPEPTALEKHTYEPTGNAGLDLALGFIGERGFGGDHPAVKAAQGGDFTQLEEALKGMGDKSAGFERYIAAGKEAVTSIRAASEAKVAANTSEVLAVVGGAEQWQAVQAWARAEATPQEREEINAGLKQGGFVAKAVAAALAQQYAAAKAQQPAPKPASPIQNGGTRGAAATDALDPAAYGREYAKLFQKLGNRTEGSQELASLRARRAAWTGR